MAPIDLVTSATGTFISDLQHVVLDHESALTAFGLACGIIICFAGRVLIRPLIFLLGSLPTTVFVAYVILAIFEPEAHVTVDFGHPTTLLVIASLLGVLCGIAVGWITLRILFTLVIFMLGILFGALTFATIYITILRAVFKSIPDLIFYGAVAMTSLVMGFFSLNYVPRMLIISTAFDGALLSSFFFGQFLGDFPNPGKLNGGLETEGYIHAAGYVVMMVVLGIFGAHNQFRVAHASGAFAEEERKIQRENAAVDEEKEPLIGDVESGEKSPSPKRNSDPLNARRFTSPRIIGGAALFENGKSPDDS